MLHEEVEKYINLSGDKEAWQNTSASRIGGYLDGYEKGLEKLDKIRAEINKNIEQEDFERSVFLYVEKDLDRANKCVGILETYKKVLDMINNLLKENNDG
jgi:hypothetical protein